MDENIVAVEDMGRFFQRYETTGIVTPRRTGITG